MSKNIIKLNKGDSYEFRVRIPDKKDTTKNHVFSDTDVVYFAILYPHQPFNAACSALPIKGYTIADQIDENGNSTGELLIKIEPKDTKCLAPGIYYYTVKLYCGGVLNENSGSYDNATEVRTIIERTKFIINE